MINSFKSNNTFQEAPSINKRKSVFARFKEFMPKGSEWIAIWASGGSYDIDGSRRLKKLVQQQKLKESQGKNLDSVI